MCACIHVYTEVKGWWVLIRIRNTFYSFQVYYWSKHQLKCTFVSNHMQKYSYSVKIYNPTRRSQFMWRDLHDVSHRFASIGALRLALYHELEDLLPDSEDYNLGYFEGKQQKKKWLVSASDLEAMYTLYDGKSRISL